MRPSQRTWAEISRSALAHNLGLLKRRTGRTPVMAVVKANAYGQGAVPVAKALRSAGVASFSVATLEEALELRGTGLGGELMVLGAVDASHLKDAVRAKVGVTFWGRRHLDDAGRLLRRSPGLKAHLKIDTGMGRLGFQPEEIPGLLADFYAGRWPGLALSSAYTHFASADLSRDRFSRVQLGIFKALPWPRGLRLHAANSAAALRYPDSHLDLVRSGIFLYGAADTAIHPLARQQRPALSLYSTVVRIARLAKGASVSYGQTYRAKRAMRVATLGCGYADGVPRLLSNQGSVRIAGKLCRILGRVTMDLMMVDVSALPKARPGDQADLIVSSAGPLSAGGWAAMSGSISYEVLCGLGPRVPRLVVA